MTRGERVFAWVAGSGVVVAGCWYFFRASNTTSDKGRGTVNALDFASLAHAPVVSAELARAQSSHDFDDLPEGAFCIDPDVSVFASGVVAPAALPWASAQRAGGHRMFVSPKKRGNGRVVLLDAAPIDWPEVVA